ncbi:hypothetical protein AND_003101 [Anopheles darlingi]|uniref:Glycoprotein-N-acetylgalactosamine 3-beta-galactosyltransferase 1 n=1 Tax=Anopheles darlingi TaxID=43151 RepID=W5JP91_ANODA|nr:hypothetical protein AND_003101 [Anopheles darlingi]
MFATFLTSSTVKVNPWLPEYYHHRDAPSVASDPHTGNELRDAFGPEKDVGKHASNEEVHAHENSSLSQQLQHRCELLTIAIGRDLNPWLPKCFHYRNAPPVASDPHTGNELRYAFGPEKDVGKHASNEEVHAHENSSLSQQLQREVRVLCWIMTNPTNHKQKALHVKRTWGNRCNKLVFMSSVADPLIDSVALPVGEGRNNLWAKTKEAFKYLYKNHLDDADWFMKADDDT